MLYNSIVAYCGKPKEMFLTHEETIVEITSQHVRKQVNVVKTCWRTSTLVLASFADVLLARHEPKERLRRRLPLFVLIPFRGNVALTCPLFCSVCTCMHANLVSATCRWSLRYVSATCPFVCQHLFPVPD